jgi:hypothetical protein
MTDLNRSLLFSYKTFLAHQILYIFNFFIIFGMDHFLLFFLLKEILMKCTCTSVTIPNMPVFR